ncbi:MAG TPA: hypothetical protein VLX91_05900 [Candidatus Acidoferrales bacterium]|nr:hypothetical protein [Candidatus Acidoferrales bacterium]
MDIVTDIICFNARNEANLDDRVFNLAATLGVVARIIRDSSGELSVHCEASEKAMMAFMIALMNELSPLSFRITSGNSSRCDYSHLCTNVEQVNFIGKAV